MRNFRLATFCAALLFAVGCATSGVGSGSTEPKTIQIPDTSFAVEGGSIVLREWEARKSDYSISISGKLVNNTGEAWWESSVEVMMNYEGDNGAGISHYVRQTPSSKLLPSDTVLIERTGISAYASYLPSDFDEYYFKIQDFSGSSLNGASVSASLKGDRRGVTSGDRVTPTRKLSLRKIPSRDVQSPETATATEADTFAVTDISYEGRFVEVAAVSEAGVSEAAGWVHHSNLSRAEAKATGGDAEDLANSTVVVWGCNSTPLKRGSEGREVTTIPKGETLETGKPAKGPLSYADYYNTAHEGQDGYVSATCLRKITDEMRAKVRAYDERREKLNERKEKLASLRERDMELLLYNTGSSTNSAGGASFYVAAFNNSESRTVKYIRFTVVPFNGVGDRVRGRISGSSTETVRAVGPIEPQNEASYEFDNVWYESTTDCVELRKAVVEYTDGHSFVYVNDLPKIALDPEGQEARSNITLQGDCAL